MRTSAQHLVVAKKVNQTLRVLKNGIENKVGDITELIYVLPTTENSLYSSGPHISRTIQWIHKVSREQQQGCQLLFYKEYPSMPRFFSLEHRWLQSHEWLRESGKGLVAFLVVFLVWFGGFLLSLLTQELGVRKLNQQEVC